MHPMWAQRREEVLRDCIVSPDVFTQIMDRLDEFVVPYQHALETEAGQRNVYLYLQRIFRPHFAARPTISEGYLLSCALT